MPQRIVEYCVKTPEETELSMTPVETEPSPPRKGKLHTLAQKQPRHVAEYFNANVKTGSGLVRVEEADSNANRLFCRTYLGEACAQRFTDGSSTVYRSTK